MYGHYCPTCTICNWPLPLMHYQYYPLLSNTIHYYVLLSIRNYGVVQHYNYTHHYHYHYHLLLSIIIQYYSLLSVTINQELWCRSTFKSMPTITIHYYPLQFITNYYYQSGTMVLFDIQAHAYHYYPLIFVTICYHQSGTMVLFDIQAYAVQGPMEFDHLHEKIINDLEKTEERLMHSWYGNRQIN